MSYLYTGMTFSPDSNPNRNPADDNYRYALDAEIDADTESSAVEPPFMVCGHLHTTTAIVDNDPTEVRELCLDCSLDLGAAAREVVAA